MPTGRLLTALALFFHKMQAAQEERRRHLEMKEFNVFRGTLALGKIPQNFQTRRSLWGKPEKDETVNCLCFDFYSEPKEREILSNDLLRFALLYL